ncbi:MAG: hypothetical protein ACR2IN_08695 [Thermoleophilaceae bacterium]|jgi:hypothetical protein
MQLAFHWIAAVEFDSGIAIIIGVIVVFFIAGGYAFSSRKGSGVGTHPETSDESTNTDAGARTNTATDSTEHGGAPHDRGAR